MTPKKIMMDGKMQGALSPLIDIVSAATNRMADELRMHLDDLLLSKLREHIPGITKANAAQYAHRMTRQTPDDEPYPERFYLDGTILLLEVNEPKVDMNGDKISYSQTYYS